MDLVHQQQLLPHLPLAGDTYAQDPCALRWFVTELNGAVMVMGGRVGPSLFPPMSAKVTFALGRVDKGGRGSLSCL